MALNINGTTGISGVDGSASTPALQGLDSNTGVSFGTDTVKINTGGSTKATIDSVGSLLMGTTSSAGFDSFGSNTGGIILDNVNSSNTLLLATHDTAKFFYGVDASFAYLWCGSNHSVRFGTNNTERLRIQNDGSITFQNYGTLFANTGLKLDNTTSGGPQVSISRSGNPCLLNRQDTDGTILELRRGWGAGGSIDVGVNSATYNTSSDYRLKENIVPISDGITRLKTLKPSRFNWIGDTDSTRDGFIAHEVTAVPEAITGTKDEVYSEDEPNINVKAGDPKYQGIDQSKLVPLLTAALQEAIAKIEVLETKVAALEAA